MRGLQKVHVYLFFKWSGYTILMLLPQDTDNIINSNTILQFRYYMFIFCIIFWLQNFFSRKYFHWAFYSPSVECLDTCKRLVDQNKVSIMKRVHLILYDALSDKKLPEIMTIIWLDRHLCCSYEIMW